jgi:hypothetical protein
LNLPEYSFRITEKDGVRMILDTIRRKYVRLTPEEWVRQHFVRYLINEGKYPAGLICIEHMFIYNKMRKRTDILVHNRKGEPVMIVECKSPDVKLDDEAFDQIAIYNIQFRVPYLVVTNGMVHYACRYDMNNNRSEDLLVIPQYKDLLT